MEVEGGQLKRTTGRTTDKRNSTVKIRTIIQESLIGRLRPVRSWTAMWVRMAWEWAFQIRVFLINFVD